jgi:predicted nucleic acid-binding protein
VVLVDTNILLHAINPDSPDASRCSDALVSLVNGSENWAVSWGILYEFLRVATHQRIFPDPLTLEQAHGFVEEWISSAGCTVIAESDYHRQALAECLSEAPRLAGNTLHDFHKAVLMREHGIPEILTLDQDFRAFPWIAIRPLTDSGPS